MMLPQYSSANYSVTQFVCKEGRALSPYRLHSKKIYYRKLPIGQIGMADFGDNT